MKIPSIKKTFLILIGLGFLLLNVIAYNHAYQFTHFGKNDTQRTSKPENLTFVDKLGLLFTGVSIPKPSHDSIPTRPFQRVELQSHELIEGWSIPNPDPKGIIIMGHGYSSNKSALLGYSDIFQELGYSTFLIDFMGSGGSGGYATTIGYKEADDIKAAYEYVKTNFPEQKIYLHGPSMAAASIMRAMQEYQLPVEAVLIECPFGTFRKTVQMRFQAMGLPTFFLPDLLMLWGGLQTGFNPYKHRPADYAKSIKVPTLLMYGEADERVTMGETQAVFDNLNGENQLVTFPKSGHENYLK